MSGRTEKGTFKVYVGNLGNNGSKKELEREFERFGRLHDVWVARNPPGFAFVEFEEYRDAEDAIKSLDGARICGERVRVEMARNRNRGGGGGGGGSRRSDYRDDRHGGGGRHYDDRGGSDRYDDRSRSPGYRSPPRRGRGRSPELDSRWGGRGGRSRSRSPRRF
ncbi:serine/arginine-rich splicing factor 3-like isoform X1 [Oculina patagonica]